MPRECYTAMRSRPRRIKDMYEVIVKMLIESGADVNAQGGPFGTTLHAASYQGSEAIVKMLVESGADVNAQGMLFADPLSPVSYPTITSILIGRLRVPLWDEYRWYGSALQAALSSGYSATA